MNLHDDKGDLALRIGCAGWNFPERLAPESSIQRSHLERYAGVFNAVEVNSSFYRSHRRQTWERWANSVPTAFRFAVKIPKTISHEHRLQDCTALLEQFLSEVDGLGDKLGSLLLQLPPSLSGEAGVAESFFSELRKLTQVPCVLEARHLSWMHPEILRVAHHAAVSYVFADPNRLGMEEPDATGQVVYVRLHGTPVIYYSSYSPAYLEALARRLQHYQARGQKAWCIFDNTASEAALSNALALNALLRTVDEKARQ